MGGLLSSDCSVSPLCNYNKIWMAYTDGNSFSGNLDAPIPYTSPNGTVVPLWFRGRANIDATLDAVARNVMGSPNLIANARHIIETGCSAGGLATYLHANYLLDYFTGKISGQYLSMPISGYFLDAVSQSGVKQYGKQIAVIHALSNASTNAECEATYTGADAFKCNMAEYVYPFIRSPIFVLNSMFDSWQTGCIMTSEPVNPLVNKFANGNCSAAPGWRACAGDPANCTPAQIVQAYLPFGAEMVTSFTATNAAKSQAAGSGGFLTSCHTVRRSRATGTQPHYRDPDSPAPPFHISALRGAKLRLRHLRHREALNARCGRRLDHVESGVQRDVEASVAYRQPVFDDAPVRGEPDVRRAPTHDDLRLSELAARLREGRFCTGPRVATDSRT